MKRRPKNGTIINFITKMRKFWAKKLMIQLFYFLFILFKKSEWVRLFCLLSILTRQRPTCCVVLYKKSGQHSVCDSTKWPFENTLWSGAAKWSNISRCHWIKAFWPHALQIKTRELVGDRTDLGLLWWLVTIKQSILRMFSWFQINSENFYSNNQTLVNFLTVLAGCKHTF